jgi:Ser/Thr protein kinase RdoA (MazF antagonist)
MDRAQAARVFTPAAREAVKAFPIEVASLELVSVSENAIFRVTDGRDGEAYVLRLHRPGYHTLEELNSERIWTRALAEAGVAVPIPLTTNDGDDYVCVPVPDLRQERQAGMTRWIEGELLSDSLENNTEVAVAEHRFEQLGAIEAAMHDQSSGWRPPAAFQRHHVDADGLMGEAPFWGPFWEHPALTRAERGLFLQARERIRGAMVRYGKRPATYGVIHADLHPGNLLAAGEALTVIDFDDSAFGWHVYDIAVALFHQQRSPQFDAIQRAFLRGYQARRALSEETLSLIPTFLLARGLAQIGWLLQRPEIDATRYIRGAIERACAQCEALELAG